MVDDSTIRYPSFIHSFQHSKLSTKISDFISSFSAIYNSKCLYFAFWGKKIKVSSDILYPKVILLFLKKHKNAHRPLLKEMEYWVFCSSLLEESAQKIDLVIEYSPTMQLNVLRPLATKKEGLVIFLYIFHQS